jgi:hypothetical protein
MVLSWREVKAAVNELTEEQLDMMATAVDEDGEMYPIRDTFLVSEAPEAMQDELFDLCDGEDRPLLSMFVKGGEDGSKTS